MGGVNYTGGALQRTSKKRKSRDPSNQTQARYFARQTGSRPEVGVSKIVADMKKCARNALPESGRRKRPTFEFRFVNAGEYRNKSEPHYVNDEELGLDELEPGYTRRGSQQVHLGSDEILGLTELEGTDRHALTIARDTVLANLDWAATRPAPRPPSPPLTKGCRPVTQSASPRITLKSPLKRPRSPSTVPPSKRLRLPPNSRSIPQSPSPSPPRFALSRGILSLSSGSPLINTGASTDEICRGVGDSSILREQQEEKQGTTDPKGDDDEAGILEFPSTACSDNEKPAATSSSTSGPEISDSQPSKTRSTRSFLSRWRRDWSYVETFDPAPAVVESHPHQALNPNPACGYFSALASSMGLTLSPTFLAPLEVTWIGPSCATKTQRATLAPLFTFAAYLEQKEETGDPEFVQSERLGLGCHSIPRRQHDLWEQELRSNKGCPFTNDTNCDYDDGDLSQDGAPQPEEEAVQPHQGGMSVPNFVRVNHATLLDS